MFQPNFSELPPWLRSLNDEDLAFLKRFVLSSGSLKELARLYSVSYPTVRLRLDRLIQKIQVTEEAIEVSPFERRLRLLLADGSIDASTFRTLLEAHQAELSGSASASQTEPKS